MCGICGVFSEKPINLVVAKAFENLMDKTEIRGRDSFGFYIYPEKRTRKFKGCVSDWIKNNNEKDKKNRKRYLYPHFKGNRYVLGHCRNQTQGTAEKHMNNHPFNTKDFVLAHNGIIYNDNYLKTTYNLKYKSECDSFIIIALIQHYYDETKNVVKAIQKAAKDIKGGYACWLFHKEKKELFLFRNMYPLILSYVPAWKALVFASEYEHLEFINDLVKEKKYFNLFQKGMFTEEMPNGIIYRISDVLGIKKYKFEPSKDSYGHSDIISYNNTYGRGNTYGNFNDEDDLHYMANGGHQSRKTILPPPPQISDSNVSVHNDYEGLDEDALADIYALDMAYKIIPEKKKILIWGIPGELNKPLQIEGYSIGPKQQITIKFKSIEPFISAAFNAYKAIGWDKKLDSRKDLNGVNARAVKNMFKK